MWGDVWIIDILTTSINQINFTLRYKRKVTYHTDILVLIEQTPLLEASHETTYPLSSYRRLLDCNDLVPDRL